MSTSHRLLALVCGFEHGGTTAVSELLRQHPTVDAGFEGGFLLAETPSDFPAIEPHYGIALRGWGLSAADMDHICGASGFGELYDRLAASYVGIGAGDRIFDKTPRYLEQLDVVMPKMPEVPVVVIVRDPRALFWSWKKRSEDPGPDWIDRFADRYLRYARGLTRAMESGLGDRVHVVQHEALSTSPGPTGAAVYEFVGLTWDDGYLDFDPRYRNVRGGGMVPGFIVEYRDHLIAGEQDRILEVTEEFAAWRWDPPAGFDPEPPPPRLERPRPGVSRLRNKEARRRARRVAASGEGGVDAFQAALASKIEDREVVIDLGWPKASPWRWLKGSRGTGYLRRFDWEATAALSSEPPMSIPNAVGGRFDVAVAHSVLPHLDVGQVRAFFGDCHDLLSGGGRLFATGFTVTTSDRSGVVNHPHSKSRSDRAPFHMTVDEYSAVASEAGLQLVGESFIEHPNEQVLLEFTKP